MPKGKLHPKIQGARNKKQGDDGEDIAKRALINMGFKCINPIATPVKYNKRAKKMVYSEAVTGDFFAVGPDGVSVLVEVKTHNEDTLPYSFLKKHQHQDLHDHDMAGGLTYLIWVHHRIAHVIPWPVLGFKPRTSLKIEQARRLCELELRRKENEGYRCSLTIEQVKASCANHPNEGVASVNRHKIVLGDAAFVPMNDGDAIHLPKNSLLGGKWRKLECGQWVDYPEDAKKDGESDDIH